VLLLEYETSAQGILQLMNLFEGNKSLRHSINSEKETEWLITW